MNGQGGSGWTFTKVLGVIVGLLGLVGFGLCSLVGTAMTFVTLDVQIVVFTLVGALLTFGCAKLVLAMFRSARRNRERDE